MDSPNDDVWSDANASERRSSRTKKRKKFDDELVESCLRKSSGSSTSRKRPASATVTSAEIDNVQPAQSVSETVVSNTTPNEEVIDHFKMPKNDITINPVTPRTSSNSRNRPSSSKNKKKCSNKKFGLWMPIDDYMLIQNVLHVNNLSMVHRGVKFSCKFTLKDISDRWSALLYDPIIASAALPAIQDLHPTIITRSESKILFSTAEQELLSTIKSNLQPTKETFQELFEQNLNIFYPKRTPQMLMNHWSLLKKYYLLSDQANPSNNTTAASLLSNLEERNFHILNNEQEVTTLKVERIPTFAELEASINDQQLLNEKPKPNIQEFEKHYQLSEKKVIRQIKVLEHELPKAEALLYPITGVNASEFESQTLAVLRGRTVKYLIRSREVTIGRSSKFQQVDIDLKLEGGASFKISRRHATIRLQDTGDFIIVCEGQKTFYINGSPLVTGNCHRLKDNSVLEIADLSFIFVINQQLINSIKQCGYEQNQTPKHANPKPPNKTTVLTTEKSANSKNPNQNMQQQKLFKKMDTIEEQQQQQQLFQIQQKQENMMLEEDQVNILLQQQQNDLDQQLQLLEAELSTSH